MENTNKTAGKTATESIGNQNAKQEIKKKLNHKLVEKCGYWGTKLDVLYETLDSYKRQGVEKLIAEYLLLKEDEEDHWEAAHREFSMMQEN